MGQALEFIDNTDWMVAACPFGESLCVLIRQLYTERL